MIQQGRKGCTNAENVKVSKAMFDWINNGHQRDKMSQEKSCTCCGCEEETLEHIFACAKLQMKKVREECFEMTEKKLRSIQCPIEVEGTFIETLQCIFKGKDKKLRINPCQQVSEAIEDQKRMGLNLMFI